MITSKQDKTLNDLTINTMICYYVYYVCTTVVYRLLLCVFVFSAHMFCLTYHTSR